MKLYRIPLIVLLFSWSCWSLAQSYSEYNYPDRKALIANVSADLQFTDFSFGTSESNSIERFQSRYSWKNAGQKSIVSFELVILRYDPFNRSQIGVKATFPGHNSATYKPLDAGQTDEDGGSIFDDEQSYIAVVYVRNIRFSDGSLWKASDADVIKEIKRLAPDIMEPGPLEPKPKEKTPPNS